MECRNRRRKMKVTLVTIYPDGDGYDGLYIDGNFVVGGDYYHDKASYVIDGFIDGLRYMGWDGEVQEIVWNGDEASEFVYSGNVIPDTLDELEKEMGVNWKQEE
jgi:hypothetical protein